MRIPISHSIAISAALCLSAAAPDRFSQIPVSAGASVSEKLRIIRENVSSVETGTTTQQPMLAQARKNCISGFWRNC